MTVQTIADRRRIAAMGRQLGPAVLADVQGLYRAQHASRAAAIPAVAVDQPYGPADRQRLDVYARPGAASRPVLLWVHGGGFVRGEKSSPAHPFNSHVGRWAADMGMVGVVMNYRLLPDAAWPSGGDDVALAVAWIEAHIATLGGDPTRVVIAGTSAGATHVATCLQRGVPARSVRGAILLSGLYGAAAVTPRDVAYLGDPVRIDPARIAACGIPLFLACAEFDPVRFQDETMALARAVRDASGAWPATSVAAGHNHFSLACHLGGSDTTLSDQLRQFTNDACYGSPGEDS